MPFLELPSTQQGIFLVPLCVGHTPGKSKAVEALNLDFRQLSALIALPLLRDPASQILVRDGHTCASVLLLPARKFSKLFVP